MNTAFAKDFPILKTKINGNGLVYLDSANTSLTPLPVIKKMDEYYNKYKANIHRGLYPLSEKATAEYEASRDKVRHFISASDRKEIIFCRNATEGINLVVQSWGRKNLKRGDTVLLSMMEHHSNIVPWQLLQKEKRFAIRYIPLTASGRLDMKAYRHILKNEKIKMVSVTHQSNVLGVINPVHELIRGAHKHGALALLDGAQAVPHMPVHMSDLDVDFYVFTGHKMLGPTGIGVLYGKEKLLEEMPPFLGGGDMIRSVEISGSTWNDLPYKFEAGTPHIAGAIGLGAAVDYLQHIGTKTIQRHDHELLTYAFISLQKLPFLHILGPLDIRDHGPLISFVLQGVHPHDAATMLGEMGICIRAGHHCAQPLHDLFKISASLRMSLYFYNTKTDIDRLIEGLHFVHKKFS